MRGPLYRWRVRHPDHAPAEVVGVNRYDAVVAAAKCWGARWTQIARECIFERLEEVADA